MAEISGLIEQLQSRQGEIEALVNERTIESQKAFTP